MRFTALSLNLLIGVSYAPCAHAIFPDEAFKIDYQHALIGSPVADQTFFHQPSTSSKASLLYSLSKKLVLGAINPKDGSVVWRQRLAENATNEASTRGFLRASSGSNTVVSAVGNKVIAWDGSDGRLGWEWETEGRCQSLELLDIAGGGKDAVVLTELDGQPKITRLNVDNGGLVWEVVEKSGDIPLAITSSQTDIFYVSLHIGIVKGFKLKVSRIEPVDAKSVSDNIFAADVDSVDSLLHVGSKTATPVMIWSDLAFKTLKANILGKKNVIDLKVPNHDEEILRVSISAPNTINAQPHFLVHYQSEKSHWAEVYHVDLAKGKINKAYDIPKAEGKAAFSASTIDANVYFTHNTDSEVSIYSSASREILEHWPVAPTKEGSIPGPERVVSATSEVVAKGKGGFAVRSAVGVESGDWELIRNGDPVWIRNEGLAGIVAVDWADISKPEGLAKELEVESHDNILAAYIHRVQRHVKDLKYLPGWLQRIPPRVISSFTGVTLGSEETTLKKDQFGFRKIVLAATENGRVVALDTGRHGQVIWSVQAVKLKPRTKWHVTSLAVENDLVLVIAENAEFVLIETMTGKIRQYQEPGVVPNIEKFISISKGSGKRTLVPIFKDGKPGQVPPNEFTNNTFIITRTPEGSVAGWNLENGLMPILAWSFTPPKDETIATVASRPTHDPVASIGKALGDRNVLYKFLSQNLILVITSSITKPNISVYLLDTVTGQTLYTTTHTAVDTSRPISATFSENWFTYTLFSDPSLVASSDPEAIPKGQILVVSELYESSIPNDRGPLGSPLNFSSISSPLYEPHVISASYVIPYPLTHLTTTSTLQGITPRSLLAYSAPVAALFAIPLHVLTSRKPIGRDPTTAEREEGLFTYSPYLDLIPQWTLSHRREVLGIKGVSVSPTLMESTSLVFAYGDLDVFGTRVNPIGAFDLLGRGFGKVQLVLTVVALAAGTGVLSPMVRKKQIDTLWKL